MLDKAINKEAIDIKYYSIIPTDGKTIKEQVENCYTQLTGLLDDINIDKTNVVKQTIFISNREIIGYIESKAIITKCSANYFNTFIPTSIIPQPPLNSYEIAMEFAIIPTTEGLEIKNHQIGNCQFITILSSEYLEIIAGGLGTTLETTDIYTQSMDAFEQMHTILSAENMDFSNIIRQWNYIEKIVSFTENNQHYQIFNDVRTAFYNNSHFVNGYPAATGIGMETAGVIIDFIAVKNNKNLNIIPIKSPVQRDAHQYSKEVIAHSDKVKGVKDTTPKFERAKAVLAGKQCLIHVSGTAAIKGEASLGIQSAATHTELTLANIMHLVSSDNLEKHGISLNSNPLFPRYFRVYVKNESDYENVKRECEKNFSKVPTIYLKADICRPELLIEIEGVFSNS